MTLGSTNSVTLVESYFLSRQINMHRVGARFKFILFVGGGVAGSGDFACATLPTTPLIFKAKFKIFVT